MKSKIQPFALVLVALMALSSSAFAHGKEFKPDFVDSLVPDYLAVQTALAGDDLTSVKAAATKLVTTAQLGPEFSAFTTPAAAIADASDLKTARTAFLTVSMEMQDLIDHVGTSDKVTLYEAFCPMAFGVKGGSWIQADKKIANPYYGSMMLRCGTVKKQLAGESSPSETSAEKSHNHD
jgi:hypothetical protein